MTSKNPSDTWFYNDWESAKDLKTCSLAAQGLWMRLLCIAAASPERGVVQIGNLNFSLPDGLTQIASAVGRPLEEIAPLIDELISSKTADVDRKKRIVNRRMVRASALSAKMSANGKKGAAVTHGKERETGICHGKTSGKPLASSSLHPPRSPTHGNTDTFAASAPAPGGARSPIGNLPSSAKWAARLDGYKPWLGRRTWSGLWGPRPDSSGSPNPLIPPAMLKAWHAERIAATKVTTDEPAPDTSERNREGDISLAQSGSDMRVEANPTGVR